ncbi:MAG: nitroreductase family protein [Bdellovibrionota bacterium]
MDFRELNQIRRSHRSYLPGRPVSRELLEKLLGEASLAPSSFNQQGWEIIAVTSQAEKERMYREGCPQPQVLSSGAMLIVCGNLEQYKNLPGIVQNTATMDENTRKGIVQDAAQTYANNPALARDEAIRSATLFAMAFMYAATNAGLGCGPMIGFDSEKICKAFEIKPPIFPVMMISLGEVKDPPFARGYRRPVGAFTRFI